MIEGIPLHWIRKSVDVSELPDDEADENEQKQEGQEVYCSFL